MTLLALDLSAYIPIGILVVMAIIFAVANLAMTHMLGPRAVASVASSPGPPRTGASVGPEGRTERSN